MLTEAEKQHNREVYREKMKKRAKKTWIVLGVILFLFLFGRLIWGIIGVHIRYSEGERMVKIIKLAEKGFIWKTWEAEGVLTQGNVSVTYIWRFSIDNSDPNKKKFLQDVRRAFETGQTIKIKYDQRADTVPWRSSTPYFVKEIRFE